MESGSSEYTPGQVWLILLGESDDLDEQIDVQAGLTRLPLAQRIYLVRLSQGYSGKSAMQEAGLLGNQTDRKREALRELAKVINNKADRSSHNGG